jgi:hypothetical protein
MTSSGVLQLAGGKMSDWPSSLLCYLCSHSNSDLQRAHPTSELMSCLGIVAAGTTCCNPAVFAAAQFPYRGLDS